MDVNLVPLIPAVQVLLTGFVVMLLDAFLSEEDKRVLPWISLLGLALCAGETVFLWNRQEGSFGNTYLLDNFALFFSQMFVGAAALTILSAVRYLGPTRIREGEFYALILFATFGMIVMAAANDLIVFFLGLETMSVAVYILTGMWRSSSRASEGAMKYFLVGAFATGFLLYGIVLVYGATGSTHLNQISTYLVEHPAEWPFYLSGGVLLILIGFAFKIGAVPFHFWVPDAYEGAPTPVTGFMAVAVKAAAFAGWTRILMHQLSPLETEWTAAVWVLAVLTMTVGNLLAITQSSVKRMLAYSSVAHAGYLLIAFAVGAERGGVPLLFYIVTYAVMTIGAFAVVTALSEEMTPRESYDDFAGLGFKRPFLAMAMSLFMLSLAGFPPLAGFAGKFYLFRAAVLAGHTPLAVIAVLNSLLSVAYYLRVIVAMYMEEGGVKGKGFRDTPYVYVAIGVAVLATVYLGVMPAPALEWSRVAFPFLD